MDPNLISPRFDTATFEQVPDVGLPVESFEENGGVHKTIP